MKRDVIINLLNNLNTMVAHTWLAVCMTSHWEIPCLATHLSTNTTIIFALYALVTLAPMKTCNVYASGSKSLARHTVQQLVFCCTYSTVDIKHLSQWGESRHRQLVCTFSSLICQVESSFKPDGVSSSLPKVHSVLLKGCLCTSAGSSGWFRHRESSATP